MKRVLLSLWALCAWVLMGQTLTFTSPSDNTQTFSNQSTMAVSLSYNTSGKTITSGITCNLIQKDAGGSNIFTYSGYSNKSGASGSGSVSLSIDISTATPTADLPTGNYYKLVATYSTSSGAIYETIDNIVITGATTSSGPTLKITNPSDAAAPISNQSALSVTLTYDTDEAVTSGITCNLIEKDENDANANLYQGRSSIVGQTGSGTVTLSINMSSVTLSKNLDAGHYYKLVGTYSTSSEAVYASLDNVTVTDGNIDETEFPETTDRPISSGNQQEWETIEEMTDEFDASGIDWTNKWSKTDDLPVVNAWKWDNNNNATNNSGIVELSLRHNTNNTVDDDTYFKSAIIQSKATKCYGYYEARIKGAAIPKTTDFSTYNKDWYGRGVCPAFWLWAFGNKDINGKTVTYSEIDVVEMQQFDYYNNVQYYITDLDLNLHTIVNGSWIRPKDAPATQKNEYRMGVDPTAEYHVYGMENRPDSVLWYVDGVLVAAQKNTYWHLDMNVAVSLGARVPFVKYLNNKWEAINPRTDGRADAKLDALYDSSNPDPNGTTRMYLDYIKVWNATPSLWMSHNSSYANSQNINLNIDFHPGSGYSAASEMTLKIVEKDESDNTVKTLATATDNSISGLYKGVANLSLSLSSVNPSSSLDAGHYYALEASFINTGQQLVKETSNVTITGDITNGVSMGEVTEIKAYPNPTNGIITLKQEGTNSNFDLTVYSTQGTVVLTQQDCQQIDISSLNNGLYIIEVDQQRILITKE